MGDEEGWITPQNYHQKVAEGTSPFESKSDEEGDQDDQTPISLLTADLAMQNVAMQMGIPVRSLEGRIIKEVRRFIYECYLCWKQYRVEDNKVRLCK
jgi:RNA-binding protein NOB1